MKKYITYFVFAVFISCSVDTSKKDNEVSVIDSVVKQEIQLPDTIVKLSGNIERIEIWGAFMGGGGFDLFVSDFEIKCNARYTTKYVNQYIYIDTTFIIDDIKKRNKIINSINMFYIEETEKIYFKRTKSLEGFITDYPFIRVKAFTKGKKKFEKDTQIGTINEEEKGDTIIMEDATYRYEYNPKFMEFYELLESLVKR